MFWRSQVPPLLLDELEELLVVELEELLAVVDEVLVAPPPEEFELVTLDPLAPPSPVPVLVDVEPGPLPCPAPPEPGREGSTPCTQRVNSVTCAARARPNIHRRHGCSRANIEPS